MHIYQAADKYCVTSLREKLLKAINSKLNSKNVLYFYESLIAFPTTKDEDLFEIYRIMDNHTKDVFETEIFKLINKDTLALILKRDNLTIREMDVYRACLAWTDHKLSKKKIEVTPNARRKSLGDMIYLIRFPLMSSTEFSSGPAKDKVLNGDEISEIYLYLNEPNYKGEFIHKFNTRPRKSTRNKSTNSVDLFKNLREEISYSDYCELIFSVDKGILLNGIEFLLQKNIYDVIGRLLVTIDEKIIAKKTFTNIQSKNNSLKFEFDPPMNLQPNNRYTIEVRTIDELLIRFSKFPIDAGSHILVFQNGYANFKLYENNLSKQYFTRLYFTV